MRKIKLYGELGKKFGKYHEADVQSVGEAIRYFKANYPEFETYLRSSDDRNEAYEVWDGNYNLEGEAKEFNKEGDGIIKIIPRIIGAGAWGRIILGVVLIVVGAFTSWSGGSSLIVAGIGLIAGGVVQLLTKVNPTAPQEEVDKRASYMFNGAVNSTRPGNCIPLGYGRMIVGSQVISASIVTTGSIPPSDYYGPDGFERYPETGTSDYMDNNGYGAEDGAEGSGDDASQDGDDNDGSGGW